MSFRPTPPPDPEWVVAGDYLEGLEDPQGLVLAPANGVVTGRGLVMGAGAARALMEALPGVERRLGEAIRSGGEPLGAGVFRYGLAVVPSQGARAPWVGALQTKAHFREGAQPALIGLGLSLLARFLEAHPGVRAHLAYPGVGLGGLRREAVAPLLEAHLGRFGGRVRVYRLGG